MGLTASAERDVHWVEDHKRPVCVGCARPFGVVRRRHHCRECGEVFCAECCVKPPQLTVQISAYGVTASGGSVESASFNSASSSSSSSTTTKRRCNRCVKFCRQQTRGGLSPLRLPSGEPYIPHLNLPALPPAEGHADTTPLSPLIDPLPSPCTTTECRASSFTASASPTSDDQQSSSRTKTASLPACGSFDMTSFGSHADARAEEGHMFVVTA